MSAYKAYLESQLTLSLQTALTKALTAPFQSADYAAQFAAQFAPPVSIAITEDAFDRSTKISKSTFMIGIGLATNLISLGILIHTCRQSPKSVRNNLLLAAHILGIIAGSLVAALLIGDNISLSAAAITIPLFMATSILCVLYSALWQTPIIWPEPYKSAYRYLSLAACIALTVPTIYYFTQSQLQCAAPLTCVVEHSWIELICLAVYILIYLGPFGYTLRSHIVKQRQAGNTAKTAVNDLEWRTYAFGLVNMTLYIIFGVWSTFLVVDIFHNVQAFMWISFVCLNEVIKDWYTHMTKAKNITIKNTNEDKPVRSNPMLAGEGTLASRVHVELPAM